MFLPGERDIRELAEALRKTGGVQLLVNVACRAEAGQMGGRRARELREGARAGAERAGRDEGAVGLHALDRAEVDGARLGQGRGPAARRHAARDARRARRHRHEPVRLVSRRTHGGEEHDGADYGEPARALRLVLEYMQSQVDEAQQALARKHIQHLEFVERAEKAEMAQELAERNLEKATHEISVLESKVADVTQQLETSEKCIDVHNQLTA